MCRPLSYHMIIHMMADFQVEFRAKHLKSNFKHLLGCLGPKLWVGGHPQIS